jgi:hypothetical protein
MAKIRCRGFIAAAFSLAAAPQAGRPLTLMSDSGQHPRAERRIRRLISYLPARIRTSLRPRGTMVFLRSRAVFTRAERHSQRDLMDHSPHRYCFGT